METVVRSPSSLGETIRRLRKARRLTQEKLAARAGVHKNTINFIETGRIKNVESVTLAAVAGALEVDVAELHSSKLSTTRTDPLVDAYLQSPWSMIDRPTKAEIDWLRRTPTVAWIGEIPDPHDGEVVHLILSAHRRTRNS
jgi:transcriptional regulator with XRE-family HTH domain